MTEGRPAQRYDVGLQHERTALAWERTAIAMMVAGVVLARYARTDAHQVIALFGLVEIAIGGGVLLWASWHYEELHAPLRAGTPVVHPAGSRIIGLSTVCFTTVAFILALLVTLAS